MDWYDEFIEEPIRPTVRTLRDNGFNTFNSCGHKMTVDCEYSPDGDVYRLKRLLTDMGHADFVIEFRVEVRNGWPHGTIHIQIGPVELPAES